MPTARLNGIEIHYLEAGEGFPILLIHGYTGNARNWALQIPALHDRFRTISLDQRGHGHSEKPKEREAYAFERMAEDAFELLRQLGVGECYLAGHSMGGVVAQKLILAQPQLFKALVLVDTCAETVPGLRWEERRRAVERARTSGMEAAFEAQLKGSTLSPVGTMSPAFIAVWREQFLMTSLEAYLYCGEGLGADWSMLDDVERISVPTLVVCGSEDAPFLEPSRHLHERIPGSELVIIEGSGHTPQIEKSQAFNETLLGFLSRVHEGVAAGS